MPRILCRYVLKEVLGPALLALFALTFIILVSRRLPGYGEENLIWLLMRLAFREEVSKPDLILTFSMIVPSLFVFIAPMALLIGIIIGVGRMTLDLEVRAMQTMGINVVWVFMPILAAGVLLSLLTAVLTYAPEPLMVAGSMRRVGNLLATEFANLDSGRVYSELFGEQGGMNFYFEGRDPESQRMSKVTLMLDRQALESESKQSERKSERKRRLKELERQADRGDLSREEFQRLEYELELKEKTESPIMIFAEEATFEADAARGLVQLDLYNGQLHMIDARVSRGERAAATEREYGVLSFGRFSKSESIGDADLWRNRRAQTVPQLRAMARDEGLKLDYRLKAKATILERYSFSLQALVFALIGLPLAVWVRPTGKSIGIVLAFALILVYHLLGDTGGTMIESGNVFGPLVIFLPNLVFAAGGAFLWWRVLQQ